MFSSLGYTEMLLIGIIALMLFGSKLPDVARNFGGTYRDLRRKVDDFQREFRDWDRPEPTSQVKPKFTPDEVERIEPTAPKFTPPPADDE
ncbi:MAG: twin-arginine translocase TatA/TatE family subunit [Pirellulaceae bacterium]|jgi:sec-independent protein translocase protein TatA|nr:twin-arginine translocase TatA/TatE family subunit [Pirellulaceae bacterium]